MPYYLKGNQIELLKNGKEYFAAVIQSIKQAKQSIFVEAYIFSPDVTGEKILVALKEAAKKGIEVYLLLDGFGSRDLSQKTIDEIKASHIHFLFYHPKISPYQMKRISLRRLHRKMFLMDHKVAFVGGINIIDDMNVPNGKAPRIDYAARLRGPVVPLISRCMVKLWKRVSWSHLENSNIPKHTPKKYWNILMAQNLILSSAIISAIGKILKKLTYMQYKMPNMTYSLRMLILFLVKNLKGL